MKKSVFLDEAVWYNQTGVETVSEQCRTGEETVSEQCRNRFRKLCRNSVREWYRKPYLDSVGTVVETVSEQCGPRRKDGAEGTRWIRKTTDKNR